VFNFNKSYLNIGLASILLVLSACGKDDPTPTSNVQPVTNGGSAITGVVNPGAGNCATGPFQLTIYSGQSIVQQSSVSPGVRFSINIQPGTYTVGASGQAGCGTQQQISVAAGQTGTVNLTMTQGGISTPTGTGYPNGYPTGYPSTNPYGYPYGYPYPNGYPTGYPSTNPYGYPGYGNGYGYGYGYGYGLPPMPTWAPPVTYPYFWMYGPQGNGYYYWNQK
jgi:hypothetical protein